MIMIVGENLNTDAAGDGGRTSYCVGSGANEISDSALQKH